MKLGWMRTVFGVVGLEFISWLSFFAVWMVYAYFFGKDDWGIPPISVNASSFFIIMFLCGFLIFRLTKSWDFWDVFLVAIFTGLFTFCWISISSRLLIDSRLGASIGLIQIVGITLGAYASEKLYKRKSLNNVKN